ncbi:hypothetical protein [Oricola sp.]|uniref:hypothetical protein n=1 Tax=Oricola sp. TaxID=1979950 RepID=UPI003BACEE40
MTNRPIDDLAQDMAVFEAMKAMLVKNGSMDDAERYHRCIIEALNNEHDEGARSASAVMEGFARALAQLVANMSPDMATGFLNYIAHRAEELRLAYAQAGTGARVIADGEGGTA